MSLFYVSFQAEASFFSYFFADAQAESNQSTYANIQTMSLPNPDRHNMLALETLGTTVQSTDYSYKNEFFDDGLLVSEVGPLGTDATVPTEYINDTVVVYTVHKGDSYAKIAQLFDISENTIRWANNLKKTDVPHVGDTLIILPVSGVSYVVKKGDTLTSIARKYNADAEEIGRYNGYEVDSELAYGETIIIPDGEISEPKPATPTKKKTTSKLIAGATKLISGFSGVDTGGYYVRPLRGGTRTQGLHGKNAVDVGAPIGTPVYAAAEGTALIATTGGYNGGYGNYIILSHPNGTQTIYGHLSSVMISKGQKVSKGQQIGKVGSTGRSTGPHLHFEVRGAKNPLGDNPRYGL
jgi:murein DD-endopeptidase MepM/ murein hydrolase activator NlpD